MRLQGRQFGGFEVDVGILLENFCHILGGALLKEFVHPHSGSLVLGELVEHRIQRLLGVVGVIRVTHGDSAGSVVGHYDDGGVPVLLREVHNGLDGVVELDELRYRTDRVLGMSGHVDLAALNHEEEALGILRKEGNGLLSHLRQRRFTFVTVNLVLHIVVIEDRPDFSVGMVPESVHVLFNVRDALIGKYSLHFIIDRFGSTGEDDVKAL